METGEGPGGRGSQSRTDRGPADRRDTVHPHRRRQPASLNSSFQDPRRLPSSPGIPGSFQAGQSHPRTQKLNLVPRASRSHIPRERRPDQRVTGGG